MVWVTEPILVVKSRRRSITYFGRASAGVAVGAGVGVSVGRGVSVGSGVTVGGWVSVGSGAGVAGEEQEAKIKRKMKEESRTRVVICCGINGF